MLLKRLNMINWLQKLIKVSSTKGLVTKTQYDSGKQGLEKKVEGVNKKIPKTSELVEKN